MHEQEEVLLRSAEVEVGPRRMKMQARYFGDLSTHRKPTAADETIAKDVFRVLQREYPGHPWTIEVHAEEGWAKFGILELLGPHWGMFIHTDRYDDALVTKLGGELLERFKIPRSPIDIAHYMSAASNIPLLGAFRAKDSHRIPT